MAEPILWAIANGDGGIVVGSISYRRNEAIHAFMGLFSNSPKSWRYWRRKYGMHPIRVRVVPVEFPASSPG